jgi:hypothetical protein
MTRIPSRRQWVSDSRTSSAEARSTSPVRVISARPSESRRWTFKICGVDMAPRFL